MANSGHDYIATGQPTRSCDWDSPSYETCNGLGFIHTSDSIVSGSWNALVDGNEAGSRAWPAANNVNAHRLISLCARLDDVPGVELWGGHIWRLQNNR